MACHPYPHAQRERTAPPRIAALTSRTTFYFDAADTSWAAEDRVIHRVRAAIADLGITVDIKNQARVHLWYQERFGHPYPQLTSAGDGIRRFLVSGTCFGISATAADTINLYAPFGLGDCFGGLLRLNPLFANQQVAFNAKARSYQARWPHLQITTDMPAPSPGLHVTLNRQ